MYQGIGGQANTHHTLLCGCMKKNNRVKEWFGRFRVPRAVVIVICTLPVALIVLFYILRQFPDVMGWVVENLSSPIRRFFGLLSSIYPISVMEILIVAAIIWFVYYVIKTIMVTAHRRSKLKILGKRVLPVLVAALYVWSLFSWLWSSGYHTKGFAEANGFAKEGITTGELAEVTRLFALKAKETSTLVQRDEEGLYIGDRREIFRMSAGIYKNITVEFPSLNGRLFTPKTMLFSWLMSRTGYTGVYFALTGESNINTDAPLFLMPATVAHELAHQLGVYAEDEANFVGILACVTSGVPVYEYAGYLRGLMYLSDALISADPDAWYEIRDTLSDEVVLDWQANHDYWREQKKVETGIGFLDSFLTSLTSALSGAVDSVYDGFLKSQDQELGLLSYGACVDLLVEYYSAGPIIQ